MAAPLGNKNGRGKKGRSGRKSYYAEKANAEELASMFFSVLSRETIQSQANKHSVRDAMVMKAWSGDVKAQVAIFSKLFPDISKLKIDSDVKIEMTQQVRDFASELAKKLKDADK